MVCREKAATASVVRGGQCSKRRPVVCHEKATTASVVRGSQW